MIQLFLSIVLSGLVINGLLPFYFSVISGILVIYGYTSLPYRSDVLSLFIRVFSIVIGFLSGWSMLG